MQSALAPGDKVGAYEVIGRLGAGGMGEVYRARDLRLGRTVALKVLRAGADPELLRRLDREARSASALNHPNIVHIYDVGEAAGQSGAHFVVMEHVEGQTLRRRLAQGPLPLAELLDLGTQLADGLARAHRAGIVHRDLKPENLMVTPEGLLKILDFGLAKQMVAPLGDLDSRETLTRAGTQAGTLLGTLEYMSPEQASGRPLDHRSDQFAVGAILHEMGSGRPAFHRPTPAQVLAAVIERDPEPLDRLRPDVPAALSALVARCLRKDPEQRFARTDEIAEGLRTLAGGARPGAVAAGLPAAPVGDPVSAEIVRPAPPPPPARIDRDPGPGVYQVQVRGRVRTYEEKDLVRSLRRGKLTGLEMARRDDEDIWQPLHESRIYRREVPDTGDPRTAARRRVLGILGGNLTGFLITGGIMVVITGGWPFWMNIWGIVLAVQLLRSLPQLLVLLRPLPGPEPAPGLPAPPAPALPGRPAPALPAPPASPLAEEAARVRALLEQRGGEDAPRLMAEVDGILKLTADLAAREQDLAEQTSPQERAEVAAAESEARARLERADLAQDRQLFERQLEVVRGRAEAMGKALRVVERLKVRREMAAHQLKQLRLDLSRGAAGAMDAPELSSRLQFIRHEVDAAEDVEEMLAARKP